MTAPNPGLGVSATVPAQLPTSVDKPLPPVAHVPDANIPRLVFFTASTSGICRRVEGWVAQVLQRRRNYRKVRLVTIDVLKRPDLAERFDVERLPTLVVVADRVAKARLECPRGIREITALLDPWLT